MFGIQSNVIFFAKETLIPKNELVDFIKSKKLSMDLIINVKEDTDDLEEVDRSNKEQAFYGTLQINSQKLKEFFEEDVHSKALLAISDPTENKHRSKIIEYSVSFLRKTINGDYPRMQEKIALTSAILTLFEGLKKLGEDFIKTKIIDRLKYLRRQLREIECDYEQRRNNMKQTKKTKKEILQKKKTEESIKFLSNASLPQDTERIKEDLKLTLKFRVNEMRTNKQLNIRTKYSFFADQPEFVSRFFRINHDFVPY